MVQEAGRRLSEALGEIDYGLSFVEWYAEEAKCVYGDTIPSHAAGASVLVVRICSRIVAISKDLI
jgi:succinate-semialdehyde dehydrogenase/glutarate-semialdehyde dehydrogenase